MGSSGENGNDHVESDSDGRRFDPAVHCFAVSIPAHVLKRFFLCDALYEVNKTQHCPNCRGWEYFAQSAPISKAISIWFYLCSPVFSTSRSAFSGSRKSGIESQNVFPLGADDGCIFHRHHLCFARLNTCSHLTNLPIYQRRPPTSDLSPVGGLLLIFEVLPKYWCYKEISYGNEESGYE